MPPTSVPHAPDLRPQQWSGWARELSRSANATAPVPGLWRALSEQPARTSGIRVCRKLEKISSLLWAPILVYVDVSSLSVPSGRAGRDS